MMFLSRDQKSIRNFWLYALRLEAGKYYVGLSSRKPEARIREHGGRLGAAWTRKYKPLEVIELRPIGRMSRNRAEKLEHEMFKEYAHKFGARNVRGGQITTTQPIFRIGDLYLPLSILEALFLGILALALIAYAMLA